MPGNARVLKAQGVHAPCQWFLHNVITVTVKRHLHRARQQAETQARAESPRLTLVITALIWWTNEDRCAQERAKVRQGKEGFGY